MRSFAARVLKEQQAIQAELASGREAREARCADATLVYEDEQMLEEGSDKSGAALDDLVHAADEHRRIRRRSPLFESATKMPNARLAAFAKKALPILQEQQRAASDLTQAAPP